VTEGWPRQLYTEIDGVVVPAATLAEWCAWWATADPRVALDAVGDYRVSTVFLGFDLGMGLSARHHFYETMVFKGEDAERDQMFRYDTRAAALAGHQRIVKTLSRLPETPKDSG
jgi:hypothetical protein